MSDQGLKGPVSGLMPLAMTTLPRLGEYEVLAELAKGGMGRVYLARRQGQAGFERLFAVKVLHEDMMDEPDALMMLLDEANIACRLHHPNVVPIVDIGEHDEGYFLVMEYVEGCTFQQMLNRCKEKRPARLIAPVLIDSLRGLHAAHELTDPDGMLSNLVHRDFSPHNLMIGMGGTCRVTDFGIAKVAARFANTRRGYNKGKLAYMSPEQLSASRDIDRRADIWAAGVVMWSSLTGEHPFRADSEAATTNRILRHDVPPASTVGLEPPDCFDIVCEKALKRDREQRYATAMDMADDLHQIAVKNDMLGSPSEVSDWVKNAFLEDLETRQEAIRTLRNQAKDAHLPVLPRIAATPGDSQSTSFPAFFHASSTGPSALQPIADDDLEELLDEDIPVIVNAKAVPPPPPKTSSASSSPSPESFEPPRETLGPPVLSPTRFGKIPIWMMVGVPLVVVLALLIGLLVGSSSSEDSEAGGLGAMVDSDQGLGAPPNVVEDSGASKAADSGPTVTAFDGNASGEAGPAKVTVTLSGLPEIARVRVDGNPVEGHSFQLAADGYEHTFRVDAVGYFQWTHRMVTPANRSQELVIEANMLQRLAKSSQPRPQKPRKSATKIIRDPGF